MIENKPVVSLEGVWKYYGRHEALMDISARIGPGEIFVLLGSNGSGKSTLLKVISGLFQPDRGNVKLFNGAGKPMDIRSRGVLFDQCSHWDSLSGYENAWFFARAYGLPSSEARSRLDSLFRWSDLWEKRDDPVSTYSYGMRRKLSMIQALAHRPRLLLLDEPSMGLDYSSRLALYGMLRDLSRSDTTVVIATNDIEEATALAARTALMRQGRIIASGRPSDLMRSVDAMTRIEVKLAAPIPLHPFKAISGVEEVEADASGDDNRIRLLVRGNVARGPVVSEIISRISEAGGSLVGVEVKEPDLGDLFLKLSRGGTDDA